MAYALTVTLSVAYSTPRPDMLFTSSRPLSPAPLPEFRRTDADLFEGVHSEASQPLTQRVLERVPELARREAWYAHPRLVSNGHVHTILAANDDMRVAVKHLRTTRLDGGGTLAAVGWSNSGTILNNVLAEQATTHADEPLCFIDAGVACATPLNMPANSANLQRPFHKAVYDVNLGKSLQRLWDAARPQFVDAATGEVKPVHYWDGLARTEQLDSTAIGRHEESFVADDKLARTALSIRDIDEALTRRQYGYSSVDDYYAAASSDQRLPLITTPLLLLNAYDDPIVPGASLCGALAHARANEHIVMALTSHGGHLGWCERSDPWAGPSWTERVACGFLEAALEINPTEGCEQLGCELFD